MFKEQGYDEFLAECIKQGEEDMKAGRGLTLEESMHQAKQVIEKKSQELNEFRREVAYV